MLNTSIFPSIHDTFSRWTRLYFSGNRGIIKGFLVAGVPCRCVGMYWFHIMYFYMKQRGLECTHFTYSNINVCNNFLVWKSLVFNAAYSHGKHFNAKWVSDPFIILCQKSTSLWIDFPGSHVVQEGPFQGPMFSISTVFNEKLPFWDRWFMTGDISGCAYAQYW